MHNFISPYELLCQSKPRQTPTFVTSYDLYSQSGQSLVHAAPSEHIASSPTSTPPEAIFPDKPAAFKRTHYISDIHTRHSAAGKNAVLTSIPLK